MNQFIKKFSRIILFAALSLILFIFSKSTTVQAQGEVGYWHFNENSSTTASDSSGNGNTGTIHGAAWTTGRSGSALQFNGTSNYVDAVNGTSLQITGAITLSGWVKIDPTKTYQSFFGRGRGLAGNGNNGYFLSYYSSNNSLIFDTYSATTRDSLTMFKGIVDTNWHYIAATWDGTTNLNGKKLYVDGVLEKQQTSTISQMGVANYPFTIGNIGSLASDQYVSGSIDEVKVYNRALSDSEIYADYLVNAPAQTPNPIALPAGSCPLGGGTGYPDIISPASASFVVTNKAELLDALSRATSGQIVYVDDNASINLGGPAPTRNITIPAGVTLASGRGNGSSQGALLYTDDVQYVGYDMYGYKLFVTGGDGVRITGIRIRGAENNTYTTAYDYTYYNGIYSTYNMTVDNSELYYFSECAVCLIGSGSNNNYIHHNYIHDNRREGLGYGVNLRGADSNALIESNIFDWNRHSISGTGNPGQSYTARYNLVLGHGNGHIFDMHECGHSDGTGTTTCAGATINIYGNTFNQVRDENNIKQDAIHIRGIPSVGAYIYNNYLSYRSQAESIFQINAFGNMNVYDNIFDGYYLTAPAPVCSATPTPTPTVTSSPTPTPTPTPIFKTADFNSDGIVNSVDFGILLSAWGNTAKLKSDINQDGIVNSIDFGIMMSQWG